MDTKLVSGILFIHFLVIRYVHFIRCESIFGGHMALVSLSVAFSQSLSSTQGGDTEMNAI